MQLYKITDEYQGLIAAIESGEIPEEAANDTLESVRGEFEAKCTAVACSIKNDNAMIAALKAEADALDERRKALTNAVESKKLYLLSNMDRVGITRIRGIQAAISTANTPPAVLLKNEHDFIKWAAENGLNEYLTYPDPKPNKTAIKAAISSGQVIEGAALAAGRTVKIS